MNIDTEIVESWSPLPIDSKYPPQHKVGQSVIDAKTGERFVVLSVIENKEKGGCDARFQRVTENKTN